MAEADGAVWYFFNTPESARVLANCKRAIEMRKMYGWSADEPQPCQTFTNCMSSHIGALSPMIVDELKRAETEYPPEIIIDAFRSAAENNKRSWAICKQNTFGLDAQQQA